MMMVGEVASPGHERWELSSYSFPAVDIGIMDFPRIPKMHSRRLYSVPRCFGVRT